MTQGNKKQNKITFNVYKIWLYFLQKYKWEIKNTILMFLKKLFLFENRQNYLLKYKILVNEYQL